MVDIVLLGDGQDIVDGPVDDESGWKRKEQEGEHDGEEHHDFLLHRVAHGWSQLLLQEHGGTHDYGKNVKGIGNGKIGDPAHERGTAKFDRKEQRVVQGDEYGNLQQHGQTTADRVHLVFFIQLHHFFIHFLPVVFISFLNDFYIGLNLLHSLHGLEAFMSQREKQ